MPTFRGNDLVAAVSIEKNGFAQPGPGQWPAFADSTRLGRSVPEVRFYDPQTLPRDYANTAKFKLVAVHAAASSVIQLGVSNIEEGSETVTLDGRTLVNGVDYDIDYLQGRIVLSEPLASTADDNLFLGLAGDVTYTITETWIVEPPDVWVLEPTATPSVTLVTCYPFYFVGHAPKRYIVKAALVDAEII